VSSLPSLVNISVIIILSPVDVATKLISFILQSFWAACKSSGGSTSTPTIATVFIPIFVSLKHFQNL
jgi:hypothetical protein